MPVVHVPASLRAVSDGRERFEVEGTTLRQVFGALRRECPALTDRIMDEDQLRPDIAVAIDGSILDGTGLVRDVAPDAEIYLVPPIGGGATAQRCPRTARSGAIVRGRRRPDVAIPTHTRDTFERLRAPY